ncbi:UDP-galactopyranose mutase [Acetobacterium malicum]|uniref:UDP-galactopyranose mutase n=1 Tax=Acetobacterium malicum TaxID=52692 RepID=UPI00164C1875
MYGQYRKLAEKESKVIFGGRLGEYKYYDMDQIIDAALKCFKKKLKGNFAI